MSKSSVKLKKQSKSINSTITSLVNLKNGINMGDSFNKIINLSQKLIYLDKHKDLTVGQYFLFIPSLILELKKHNAHSINNSKQLKNLKSSNKSTLKFMEDLEDYHRNKMKTLTLNNYSEIQKLISEEQFIHSKLKSLNKKDTVLIKELTKLEQSEEYKFLKLYEFILFNSKKLNQLQLKLNLGYSKISDLDHKSEIYTLLSNMDKTLANFISDILKNHSKLVTDISLIERYLGKDILLNLIDEGTLDFYTPIVEDNLDINKFFLKFIPSLGKRLGENLYYKNFNDFTRIMHNFKYSKWAFNKSIGFHKNIINFTLRSFKKKKYLSRFKLDVNNMDISNKSSVLLNYAMNEVKKISATNQKAYNLRLISILKKLDLQKEDSDNLILRKTRFLNNNFKNIFLQKDKLDEDVFKLNSKFNDHNLTLDNNYGKYLRNLNSDNSLLKNLFSKKSSNPVEQLFNKGMSLDNYTLSELKLISINLSKINLPSIFPSSLYFEIEKIILKEEKLFGDFINLVFKWVYNDYKYTAKISHGLSIVSSIEKEVENLLRVA